MKEKVQKISPIKQRILQFVDYLDISKREFYRNISISRGTLESNSSITEEVLAKFIAKYPQVSPEWLLTGEGDMLKKFVVDGEIEAGERSVLLPLIPISAVAGFDGTDRAGVRLMECRHYAVPDFEAAGAEYLVKVSGDSMLPRYRNGDILACRKLEEINFIQWGHIYVIDSSQGAMVKRLFDADGDERHVVCKSDNEAYPPFKLPKTDIRSLSIIVGLIRLE